MSSDRQKENAPLPDGPPPPYRPPRMTHTLYYLSVGNLAFRFLVFLLGFGAMLVSVFASRGGYNPTLPTAICLPLLWWGLDIWSACCFKCFDAKTLCNQTRYVA